MKSVFGLEDKVRQEMYKSSIKKKMAPISNISLFDGIGGRDTDSTKEIMERLNNKKLPDHVKKEIEKEMKRMGG